jgi:hypothetical protein
LKSSVLAGGLEGLDWAALTKVMRYEAGLR